MKPCWSVMARRSDPELEAILYEALEVWEGSAGAFDPTVGPLIDLWTEAVGPRRVPRARADSRSDVEDSSARESLLLPGDGIVGVTNDGVRLDLDGLSKGVVLDQASPSDYPSRRSRTPAALFSFGESSVFAIGDPDGRPQRRRVASRRSAPETNAAPGCRRSSFAISRSRSARASAGRARSVTPGSPTSSTRERR